MINLRIGAGGKRDILDHMGGPDVITRVLRRVRQTGQADVLLEAEGEKAVQPGFAGSL